YWRIVNRQGEQLYETFDRNGQWDGTYRGSAQPSGTYLLELKYQNALRETKFLRRLIGLMR
ncbi:MAG: gliding motility-associated C-terminal domain-containing protein, partial [Chitinophagales bacterium]|nr:gliding motility-associated C-terminal domain-containing protein [Chitinophagales bacterium]